MFVCVAVFLRLFRVALALALALAKTLESERAAQETGPVFGAKRATVIIN